MKNEEVAATSDKIIPNVCLNSGNDTFKYDILSHFKVEFNHCVLGNSHPSIVSQPGHLIIPIYKRL